MIQLVRSTSTRILGPLLGLGLCDEITEDIYVDALCDIMPMGMYPIAIGVLAIELDIATCRRNQKGLYVPFKSFLAFIHGCSLHPFLFLH